MNELVQAIMALVAATQNRATGLVRARRGAVGTSWGSGGTTSIDTATDTPFFQVGTSANGSNPTAHSFPVAFSGAPVVIANVVTATGANTYAVVSGVSTTGFNCQVVTDAGAANTNQTISWIAIGV